MGNLSNEMQTLTKSVKAVGRGFTKAASGFEDLNILMREIQTKRRKAFERLVNEPIMNIPSHPSLEPRP